MFCFIFLLGHNILGTELMVGLCTILTPTSQVPDCLMREPFQKVHVCCCPLEQINSIRKHITINVQFSMLHIWISSSLDSLTVQLQFTVVCFIPSMLRLAYCLTTQITKIL
jgi:hypothetical protein